MPYRAALVSHAYADNAVCDPYVEAVRGRGVSIFYDRAQSQVRQEIRDALYPELQRVDALIVMVTLAALDSLRVDAEISEFSGVMAKDPTRLLILVMLEPCEPPPVPKLAKPLVVDATTQPLDQVVDELIKALEIRDSLANSLSDVVYSPTASPPVGVPRRRFVVAVVTGTVGIAALAAGAIGWSRTRLGPRLATPLAPFTYRGHSDGVYDAAWAPDGKRIASGGFDTTVQVWDAANGGHLFTYRGHINSIWSVAWSPDGKRIASASDDGTVQVWDATDGGHHLVYQGHPSVVFFAAWSPDGKRIASASKDGTVHVWDATDGGHPFIYRGHGISGHSVPVFSVAWSPDGKRIASASADTTVQIWDAADGSHPVVYHGHSDVVHSVAWSPNGKHIVSGSRDNTVQIWDASVSDHAFTYRGHSDGVLSAAWSPDGRHIASCGLDRTVQMWDAADGGHVYFYLRHTEWVLSAAWSPSGLNIASASIDRTVQVWRPQ